MGTVPTSRMERELRKHYLQWLAALPRHENDLQAYIDKYQKESLAIISKLGGHAASLGALADFPVPKTLDLSPVAGVVYDQMKQAAISASITAGLNAKDAARQMLHAGLDKSYRRLERLARTETVSAYWNNQWDSTDGLGLVMVWSSEDGPRTCDYCRSRDGLVVEDRTIRDHPNGRCTLIPTFPSRVAYKGTLQPGKQAAKPEIVRTETWKPVEPLGNQAQALTKPVPTKTPKGEQLAPVPPLQPRIIKSERDMEDFGKAMPAPSSLGDSAARVMDDYAKGTAYTANAVLRGQKAYRGRTIDARTKTYTKKFTKDMDKMMDASVVPEDVRVVRAVQADAFGGIEELQKLAGGIYQDKGYMSTSLAEKVSGKMYDVKDGIEMEINVPKGTRAIYMAGESYLKNERELLLDRGTRLAVESVKYDEKAKKWKLKATVVPGPR